MIIEKLIRSNDFALKKGRSFSKRRDLFGRLESAEGRHFTGIVGPRGVGKTVLLQQLAAQTPHAFYLSADMLDRDMDGFELVRRLAERFGYRAFFLDEIHHLPAASGMLKKLFDFLDVRVVFTSSVALAMEAPRHDLSRRVRLWTLLPFSYREYLRIVQEIELPPLSFADLLDRRWSAEHLRAGAYFDDFLRGGNMPFALDEPDPLPLMANIRDKIIGQDVPRVLKLTLDELDSLHRMLRFVGRSAVDGLNYSSLSRNLGITKYKAAQYAGSMEQAFVLRQVFPAGTNVLREPKILLTLPYRLLYLDYPDAVGGLREDYCVEALMQAGFTPSYLKSVRGTKIPDYMVEWDGLHIAVEIGGRGKGRQQFKGIQADRKIVLSHTDAPQDHRIPLFLLGMIGPTQ